MLMRPRHFTRIALLGLLSACEPTNQGYAPEQPIRYSHATHAGLLRIGCQYCHYAAERGRHAGIPPAQICMNCHAQVQKENPEILKVKEAIVKGRPIAWVKVHFLPDHVFFDHSAHVNGGLACQICHGPVESMIRVEQWAPLTMGWCLGCHRAKSDGGSAGSGPVRASPLTDCSVCHH
jgi:hypothetical protein